MRIEINIKNRHVLLILLFIIAASTIGLVMAYGGTAPSTMGHSWGEIACPGCITNPNLADNSVTGIKIQDGSITTADISSIDGSKITGTVPNAQNAQTIGGRGIGNGLYSMPVVCGGGVTTAASCDTVCCASYEGCYAYYDCSGACDYTKGISPATCSTTYLGRLLA